MVDTYRVVRNLVVPMSDGTELRADLWLPDAGAPVTTLLQRIPYDKSSSFMSQHIVNMECLRALDKGFAVMIQDTRGRFESGGQFQPFLNEASDGRDTIAWLRKQPFSNGKVAMYGASYIGATQMLAAMEDPEGLIAIAPQLTTGEYRQFWTYRDGALQLGFVLLWIIESLAGPDLIKRSKIEGDSLFSLLAEYQKDPLSVMSHLPINNDELAGLAPYVKEWLDNPSPGPYWQSISPSHDFSQLNVPALHIAGWYDIFLEGGLASYQGLREEAASVHARNSQYLIVGPWAHGNMSDWQGDVWHGYEASADAFDLTGRQLEFFKALEQGREPDFPRVEYFTTGSNTWNQAEEWPPPSDPVSLFLNAGRLSIQMPSSDATPAKYVSDPLNPVPTVGGASFLPGVLSGRNSGPKEQGAIERRPDVLIYTSPVLQTDWQIDGEVTVDLWGASSAEDCDWVARLTDVDPEGRSLGLVDGILRSRYREDSDQSALAPNTAERFKIRLGNVSHLFKAGHRIRLQVASSNFPRFDRNPQTMDDPTRVRAEEFMSSEQYVFQDSSRPSRLVLPTSKRGNL